MLAPSIYATFVRAYNCMTIGRSIAGENSYSVAAACFDLVVAVGYYVFVCCCVFDVAAIVHTI